MVGYQPSAKSNIFNLNNVNAQKVLDSIRDDEEKEYKGVPGKRKRLEDFTPQERLVRRKLKNRAAAQSARDRKKERMDYLEKVVAELEKENKELKKSNEEMRTNMHILMNQNKELLECLQKKEVSSPVKPVDSITSSLTEEREPVFISDHTNLSPHRDHTYFARPKKVVIQRAGDVEVNPGVPSETSSPQTVVVGDNHAVIKKEDEAVAKHASLGISLPQKLRLLLVSLITMWLTNPRLTNHLDSLSWTDQEKILKRMIIRKVGPKLRQRSSRAIQTILQTDLVPILKGFARKRQQNSLSYAKRSRILSAKRTRRLP